MLSEEQQNQINRGLAIMFTMNMLIINGLKKVQKDIDSHKDYEHRIYFRKLVAEGLKEAKKEGIKIRYS